MKTCCAYCNKELERSSYRAKKGNCYCSASHQMLYEYDNGIRNKKTIVKNAHKKTRELIKEGRHSFQQEEVKELSRQAQRTEEYRKKASIAKLGKKNGMYGRYGKLHPNWNSILCVCQYCGKEFYLKKSHVDKGCGKYCTRECFNCATENHLEIICETCGKVFVVSGHRENTAHFCSLRCRNIGKQGEKASTWMGGKSFEPYLPEFNNALKKRIRQRDGYVCQICRKQQVHRALSVHHVDYDKTNNNETNLISLCLTCHRKTNHNRDYWQFHLTNLLIQRNIIPSFNLDSLPALSIHA